MGISEPARCPACGSTEVTNRGWRLWLVVAIALVAGAALVIDGMVDGWGWANVAGLIGLVLVALVNTLAAIVAPWKCGKCKGVWH